MGNTKTAKNPSTSGRGAGVRGLLIGYHKINTITKIEPETNTAI